ncbi:MAG: LysR family transcriptional regulator [Salaquimonas sp.]|jgi:DNA-binding transcriptional LysR family regulator|nr:LysR family transcriptional regulator [Salaquimonas sp.]
MKNVSLDALDLFADVARTRSFRRTAATRGVSPATVSQTVKDLEARLGMRLLNRTTRSVAPTEAGSRLLEKLAPALADARIAVDQASAEPGVPTGTLRINAPLPAIDLVLAPMVPGFLAAYPQIRLEIVSEPALVDIVAEGFDAGVRWDEDLPQDMVAVRLGGEQRYALVASPALIAEYGMPAHPRDLMNMPCIRQTYNDRAHPWEFERDGEVLLLDPPSRLVSMPVALKHRAAIDGVGFWATFEGYVADDIKAGRLVSVLEDWFPPFPGPYLYFPGNRFVPPPLRAFIDYVKARRSHA